MPQEHHKCRERRQVEMGIGRHTHLGAGRPVKHPGRNLQPTVRIGTAQATAKNSVARPLDRRVNANLKTKPRMPWVQKFSKLGSVGVLKRCCTTGADLTRALTAHARSSLLHPAAHPHGSLTPADAPLIDAEKLFRQPGPSQSHARPFDWLTATNRVTAIIAERIIALAEAGERIPRPYAKVL